MEIKITGTVEEITALVAATQERRKEDISVLSFLEDASGNHGSQDGIEIRKC